ncbi:hypothetical protein TanjilG_06228 [Lupinus angustifolius]|uniref:DUF7086 domain-containing protein n=1 Tax=Lupinus angustifolius TaxID=3871 RepID=A0A1J7GXK7_LUPAN|nr:PREDICTED: uncharacterized protein LOC109356188 [Lupinus angustifolius]OIW05092.1 hypothetical protein TanjilG_06228 [Lupinus angustifolius]
MDININVPNSEENNNEWLNLSLSISSKPDSQQMQPNLQLEPARSQSQPQPNIQPELTQPKPKWYKPNPFTFQHIPLEISKPSFSPLLEYDLLKSPQVHPLTQPYTPLLPANYFPSTSQPQLQPRTEPYIQSLQETYFSVLPSPTTSSMLQQPDNMHEKSRLPPSDFQIQEPNVHQDQDKVGPSRLRPRKVLVRATNQATVDTINPPYQWTTSTRATIHSLEHLISQNIISISGKVKCKQCGDLYEIEFNLRDKFNEVVGFIIEERDNMYDRAPQSWTKPVLQTCNHCGKENTLEPVFTKKRIINWLFLFLGQMIGCCKIEYLKYFLKHTKNHRTGAKDRLVYYTYLGICKQLSPNGPFNP